MTIYATKLIDLVEKKQVVGCVTSLVLANSTYIIKKACGEKIADNFLADANKIFKFIGSSAQCMKLAIENPYKDFEDDLHYYSAIENKIPYIITRNKNDFIEKGIIVKTAEEYLIEKGYI